jgi:DNA-binding CsgD family transcriptional regulator
VYVAGSAELLERIQQSCHASLPAKALRERVISVLRRAVPFDGYNFPLTDPTSNVATSPLAELPMLPWPRLPALIRLRYLTPVCRWDQLLASENGATSLLQATAGQPAASLVWRELQRDLGVTDTATVALRDRYGGWAVLDLWRTSTDPFTKREIDLLSSLAPPVAEGLRRAVARTFTQSGEQQFPVGSAVLVLNADLTMREQTEAAAEALLRLNPPDEPIAPVPAAAYNVAAALVAAEHGMPIGPAWSRIHLGGNRWVTAKASRLGEQIAVSIEPSTADERMDLYGRACGLSERELQVLALLGAGLDTRDISTRLVVSQHTAADHVKSVLAKTGAHTRQLLLARGLGGR